MFSEIFSFELKTSFRKPATYVYFIILFALTFLIGLAAAGVFDTTRTDSNMQINSAYAVSGLLLGSSSSIFSILVSVLLISIMAVVIQKDYQYNMHPLFYTKPITKPGYFFGRFLAATVVALFVFSGLLAGYFSGSLFALGKSMMGPMQAANYLQPFFVFIVPNILFQGILFFSLTTFLRSTMAAYVVAIVLMVAQVMASTITADIDNKMLAAILEPSGSNALNYITQYWSPVERNEKLIPLTGALLYNRLLWGGLALLIGALSYWGFSFSQFLQPLRLFKKPEQPSAAYSDTVQSLSDLPQVQQQFSSAAIRQQVWWMGLFEMKKMVRSVFFLVMALLGIGVMLLVVNFMDSMYNTPTYMVTYKIVEDVAGAINLFAVIFIIFYSGTTIWRERDHRVDELVGVTPVRNSVLFFSKFIGLSLSALVMMLVAAVTGICIQLYAGFYQIDLLQYGVSIVRGLASVMVLIAFCLSVQVYTPNKYVGFFISLVPLVILPIIFGLLEWGSDLIDFNSSGPSDPYSDMNGYGSTFNKWPFFRLYWTSFAAILVLLALLVYPRGKEKRIKARWRLSAPAALPAFRWGLVAACVLMAAAGGFIFYQTRVLQAYTKPKEQEKKTAQMEKKYGKYKTLQQPRIIAVKLEVDIYPSSKELRMAGTYVLQNKTNKPIDTLYVDYMGGEKSPYRFEVFQTSLASQLISDDPSSGIRLLRLKQPLAPGDSMQLVFDMRYKPRGLFDKGNSPVVSNGTFVNSSLLPSFGYNEDSELGENTAREEYGLPPKPRMAKVNDSVALMNNYISRDADWIRFEATVSTEEGQIALAPGYLQQEWKQNGRHYFHYKMDSPILNFYSFLSARYEVKRDKWNDVNIEIYYQKGHEYNLDRMIRSIKQSLDYYTVAFGPYQHRQVRILEFPRYASFAQSFPNTIPYSESIGFITRVDDDPNSIDVPFYVTAHEVAHQWWAHQVIGGNVQGSVLMSETLSQYSALMVMEREYGKEAMKKFLKYEMDQYLLGRTFDGKGELPLMLTENQQYIHYNKGSVVMYALKDLLGETVLNGAIRNYLNQYKFAGSPYSNSIAFVQSVRNATPDSLQYLITDLFERIAIYENYVKALDAKKQADGSYRVTLTVGSAKFYADSIGRSVKAPVSDYMDIGIFSTATEKGKEIEKPLLLQRIKMTKPEQTFEFTVPVKPVSAGIDPLLKLVDRTPRNNVYKFGEKPAVPDLSPTAAPSLPFE